MTLYFDLNAFLESTDSELLKRVDRRVASYYLAVPLAGEDDQVTVATAYPDNAAALRVLGRLLRADIVPVSSTEDDLQQAIARIYPELAPGSGSILVWTDDPGWTAAVVETANAFGRAADSAVIILDPTMPLESVLAQAGNDYALLVTHVSDATTLERLVRRSPVSLLLVRGDYRPIDHVLVALRGFGSDQFTLDHAYPIITFQEATTTVLPLSRPNAVRGNGPSNQTGHVDPTVARQHLKEFLQGLGRQNARVDIRLSQGDPVTQIVNELANGCHGLLVVAAEAEGEFVSQVLGRIEQQAVWPGHPILVVNPPVRLGAVEPDAPSN